MRTYYERRAREYDDWYHGLGRFDGVARAHWDDDLRELEVTLAKLRPARTLDVACGTGFLTRHLPGDVTGLDQSEAMLTIARERMPTASFVAGDALTLPFADDSFERVFTGHFYGHLDEAERLQFIGEANRVASELVVADASKRADREAEEWQKRLLSDGSTWRVYKRYFSGDQLLAELGAGDILLANRWFVVVSSARDV